MIQLKLELRSLMLDRYYLKKSLGKGGYGEVFQAFDTLDKVEVAIKVSLDKVGVKERNVIEAKLLEIINTQDSIYANHVVKMKRWLDLDHCVVMVMELMSHTLARSIEDKEFNSFYKISVCVKQMVEFLVLMDQMQIIHGDIKPQNILVEKRTNKLKFADFSLGYCPRLLTRYKRSSIQTLFYRAPEVIMGCDYNSSVDVWSAGCVLVECLVQTPLFDVTSEMELLQRIANLIGTPDQRVIEKAPLRDRFFKFHSPSKQWIVRGFSGPVTPMGIREILISQNEAHVKSGEFNDFVDLAENMMRVDPRKRYSPYECQKHRFTELANYF